MIWLLLSIACSATIILVFKAFAKYNVHTFRAIVINYFVCVLVGLPLTPLRSLDSLSSPYGWIPLGLLLGFLFITLFFLIGRTTQTHGVATASVSMKLGYVLPIVLGLLVYKEHISPWGMLGAALTVFAVFLTAYRGKKDLQKVEQHGLVAPFVIFLGSGIADSIVQYVEKGFFPEGGFEVFNIVLFGTAGLLGLLFWLIRFAGKPGQSFQKQDIVGGILLGIPNYGSIYFFLKTLNEPQWESVFVFPINNIGIVLTSALLAYILFKERLNAVNLLGLLIAVASIVLLALR